jgi:hypothetical protein
MRILQESRRVYSAAGLGGKENATTFSGNMAYAELRPAPPAPLRIKNVPTRTPLNHPNSQAGYCLKNAVQI